MPSILNNSSAPLTGTSIANAFGDSLLSAGRQINKSGIGLSATARQGIEGFISATQSGYNGLFSLAVGPSLTVEGMQTQINGLRASLPVSRISAKLIEEQQAELEKQQAAADTAVSASSLGQTVDTEA